jgi:hypothetical protein
MRGLILFAPHARTVVPNGSDSSYTYAPFLSPTFWKGDVGSIKLSLVLDENLTNEERSSWRSVLVDELESWQWKRKAGRNSLHLVCIVYFHASLPSIYLHHPAVLQAPISSSRMQALYGLLHHAIEEKSGESRRGRKEKPEQRRRSSGNEIADIGMFMSIMYLTQLNVYIILLFAVCPFIQLRLSIVLGQPAPTLSI